MPDNPKRIAIKYGPLVLAADMGPGSGATAEGAVFRTPVITSDPARISEWLRPVPGQPLTFRTEGAMQPQQFTFVPFHSLFESRYGVYFDLFTPAERAAKAAEYRAEEARLQDIMQRTVDSMNIGEMQPERDHNLTQERNDVREQNNRGTRQPMTGGWVEFDMAVPSAGASELMMTYWGNDRIRPEFVILVDGQQIARGAGRATDECVLRCCLRDPGGAYAREDESARADRAGGGQDWSQPSGRPRVEGEGKLGARSGHNHTQTSRRGEWVDGSGKNEKLVGRPERQASGPSWPHRGFGDGRMLSRETTSRHHGVSNPDVSLSGNPEGEHGTSVGLEGLGTREDARRAAEIRRNQTEGDR